MHNQSNSTALSFFKLESAGGMMLIMAAALAMILANSPLRNLPIFSFYSC